MSFHRLRLPIVFFLSGAAALAQERIWIHWLELRFGGTPEAFAVFLCLFFLGQGAGALAVFRFGPRIRNPLAALAMAETAVALCGVVVLLWGPAPPLLGIAAAAMGAAVPLASAHDPSGGARLYAWNTLGGLVGLALTGTGGLAVWGHRGTFATALVVNGFAAALAATAGGMPRRPPPSPTRNRSNDNLAPWIATSFAFGFAGLAAETLWTRAFALVSGSSAYTVTLVTGATVGAWFVGAWWGSGPRRRAPNNVLPMAGVVTLATAVVTFPWVIPTFWRLYRLGLPFPWFLVGLFGLVVATVGVPFVASGYAVAVALTRCQATGGPRGFALCLAANIAGSAVAPLVVTFGPGANLGTRSALIVCLFAFAAAAVSFAHLTSPRRRATAASAAVACLALGVGVGIGPWDLRVLHAGLFTVAPWFQKTLADGSVGGLLAEVRSKRLLFQRDGPEGSVAVWEHRGNRYLSVNGKPESSASRDLRTQLALGILPSLVGAPRDRALVIGFGSGTTAAALAATGAQVVCAELSGGVIEAGRWFEEINRDPWPPLDLTVVRTDGRRHLAGSAPRSWSAIVSQPSNPWVTGSGGLFTREFFRLAASRLAPGGVMVQWAQAYAIDRGDLETLLATFAEAFPEVHVFSFRPGDLVLVGADHPPEITPGTLETLSALPGARDLLTEAGLAEPEAFLGAFWGRWEKPSTAPLNTDDHPRLTYALPRALFRDTVAENSRWLTGHLATGPTPLGFHPDARHWNRMGRARTTFGFAALAAPLFRRAVERAPDWPEPWNNLGVALYAGGDRAGATRALARAMRLAPGNRSYRDNFRRITGAPPPP